MPELDSIGVVVSDLKRAVTFYRVLGIDFPAGAEESEHGPPRHRFPAACA